MENKKIKIGFWGGHEYSVITAQKLHDASFTISFIVTSLDQPKGRNLLLTPSPLKVWGLEHGIPIIQPEKLKDENFIRTLKDYTCDIFIVMAYGRIMPEEILGLPKSRSLNLHPSLLPKFRGPCPIESAILADDRDTGVTIMLMDKEMDHGPIVAQEKVAIPEWPPFAKELGEKLVTAGADLLVSILPDWIAGKIPAEEQDHAQATYTKKIKKEDGLIDLADDSPAEARANYLKYKAYQGWPSVYFLKDGKRIKISQASFENKKFTIEKVIPQGKPEMLYTDLR